jgi:oligoribonuclease NrnB/cAMP/cGMP phosphodiesterase (DHH superfamily)
VINSKKNFIFTDCDLDGAGSYIMWSWFTGIAPDKTSIRVNDFEITFNNWVKQGGFDRYEHVYVLDLDVSRISDKVFDLLDNKQVTIIDHHQTHVDNLEKYKNANTYISKDSSCTKMVYNIFKSNSLPDSKVKTPDLSPERKLLTAMINDYDSYTLKIPESYHLNLLYWNYQGDRIDKFLIEFANGFSGFTDKQKRVIDFYLRKLEKIKKDLDIHWASIPIGSKKYRFISVFANECINEVADHIIKNYKADIGLVINMKSGKVSLRRRKECTLKLGNFADKLFDQGGGHDEAAGGVICDNFLKFSNLFKPMKLKIGT